MHVERGNPGGIGIHAEQPPLGEAAIPGKQQNGSAGVVPAGHAELRVDAAGITRKRLDPLHRPARDREETDAGARLQIPDLGARGQLFGIARYGDVSRDLCRPRAGSGRDQLHQHGCSARRG